MTTKKKKPTTTSKRPKAAAKKTPTKARRTPKQVGAAVVTRTTTRARAFLGRRPHRSFRLTRRRDYVRSLRLPGYWKFTAEVFRTLRRYRGQFLGLGLIYGLITGLLVGMTSQETVAQLRTTLEESDALSIFGDGAWLEVGKSGLLALNVLAGGATATLTAEQQIYSVLAGLLVWMTAIWLLRHNLAGQKVRLRDGLYNGGAPLVGTTVLALVLLIQLVPVAVAALGYSAALATGLLDGGVEAMLFWFAAGGLTLLSLYWISSTLVAMVIITLPGMYPLRSLKIAGDMVVGRRLRILLRLLWGLLVPLVVSFVILVLVSLLDQGLKHLIPAIDWLPIIPIVVLLVGIGTLIWASAYIYLLYRKVVDDDAAPA